MDDSAAEQLELEGYMQMETDNLIWIDLEMTGLDTVNDRIIEVATIVTDKNLNTLAEGPVLAVRQADSALDAMDKWNTTTHTASGLVQRVKDSTLNERAAELQTLEFLKKYVAPGASPMCGNSICQDRRFLHRWMPELENFFHYRHIDVTTVKIVADLWYPDISSQYVKQSTHQALNDIRDSIAELKFYRENVFVSAD